MVSEREEGNEYIRTGGDMRCLLLTERLFGISKKYCDNGMSEVIVIINNKPKDQVQGSLR